MQRSVNTITALFICIAVLALVLRAFGLTEPYVDHHSWRQTDTAMIAQNLYENGYNIFQPEVNWNGAEPSVMEMEFQVTTFLTALLYPLFGIQDWVGRIIPILFSLLSLWYLFRLVSLHWNEKAGLFAAAVYAVLPLNVFFSRVLMPESGMLFFSIAAIYYLSRFAEKENTKTLIKASIFMALAFLVKLYTLFLLLPLAMIVIMKYKKRIFKQWKVMAAFLAPLLLTAAYFYYIHTAADIKNIPYELGADKWGSGTAWTDGDFYTTMFNRLTQYVMTWVGLAVFIGSLFIKKIKGHYYAWLAGVVLFFFIIARGNQAHSYYQMPLIPIASVFIGVGLYTLYSLKKQWGKIISLALLLAITGLSLANLLPLYDPYAYASYSAGQAVQKIDTEGSLILSVPHRVDMFPEILYYADRSGWVLRPEQLTSDTLEAYTRKGARYLVLTEAAYVTAGLMSYFQDDVLEMNGQYIIIRLKNE